MRYKSLAIVIALFVVVAPVFGTGGVCGFMNADIEARMTIVQSDSCQADETGFCAPVESTRGAVSGGNSCYSGNLCVPHFFAIDDGSVQSKLIVGETLYLISPAHFAILGRSTTPEIKPPIRIV